MSDQFLGQVLLVGFNFAPVGWATCSGQLMPISRSTALFSLLGTFYGGDGRSTFGLPNLQGNCAVGMGQGPGLANYDIGETGGSQTVTLNSTEVPSHTHSALSVETPASTVTATNNSLAKYDAHNIYYTATQNPTLAALAPSALSPPFGGNLPHNNMMPYLTLNWVIALTGVFPARS
jgi:microcystin-dependent protein